MGYLFRFPRKGRVRSMTIQTPMNTYAKVRTWPVMKARATSRLRMTARDIQPKGKQQSSSFRRRGHGNILYIAMRWAIAHR
jgi:hypothetical protein